ncbi:MAG: hypothetical protein FRX48_06062 [Lasallia pustulata]|uniref:Actin-like ATPase domain-containing protein n=1 Tax=Lasallia pustulata TaxID=136370 RepID=A0A5M8PMI0_9LECA|nr:MAG: hypothetical protein FRX48_06062 [Lasallia pustulata]
MSPLKRQHVASDDGGADRKILMAVDFGTTFSGLAWSQTRKPEIQTPIIRWPDAVSGGLEGISSDKVPTELKYDGQNYKWGFEIGDTGQRYKWFKLDLDSSQDRSLFSMGTKLPDTQALPPGYSVSSEKLVTDYLTALRKHAEQVLGYYFPQSALRSTPIEFIITVPAVWSDAAQLKTRVCAQLAGMGSASEIRIISEPEAAAIYALDAMDPHELNIGDTFVLCDAGGGTVDLISYTVSALKPILEIDEAAPGTGACCGSTFLNRRFEEYMKDKFGNDNDWDEEVLEEAMKRFELVVKRTYSDVGGQEFTIPVPGLTDNPETGVRRGKIVLGAAELRGVFRPVIDEVIILIKGQVRATKKRVKAVLLVGGFGQSAYLRDSIRGAMEDSGIEVMQSPNGWTAVVRGALMKGLMETSSAVAGVKINARAARKHYGTESSKQFREQLHDIARRYWNGCEGEYRINTIDWFISKGALVREEEPTRLNYTQKRVVFIGHPMNVKTDILVCSDPINIGAPVYKNLRVAHLVTLTADLSRVSITKFPKLVGKDGLSYYNVTFQIEITHYSAYTKYELIHNGINYGAINAEYV